MTPENDRQLTNFIIGVTAILLLIAILVFKPTKDAILKHLDTPVDTTTFITEHSEIPCK